MVKLAAAVPAWHSVTAFKTLTIKSKLVGAGQSAQQDTHTPMSAPLLVQIQGSGAIQGFQGKTLHSFAPDFWITVA